MVAKIKAERSSGIYSFDVTLAGIRSMAQIFRREGLLEADQAALGIVRGARRTEMEARLALVHGSGAALKIDDLSGLALTHA